MFQYLQIINKKKGLTLTGKRTVTTWGLTGWITQMVISGVGILSGHGGKGIASQVSSSIASESGRVMSSRRIVVGRPIQPVTSGQLMLLQFHQWFDLISCRGHSRRCGWWGHCRIPCSGPGVSPGIAPCWLIVWAPARVRARARQFSEIQRRGDCLKTTWGKIYQAVRHCSAVRLSWPMDSVWVNSALLSQ